MEKVKKDDGFISLRKLHEGFIFNQIKINVFFGVCLGFIIGVSNKDVIIPSIIVICLVLYGIIVTHIKVEKAIKELL